MKKLFSLLLVIFVLVGFSGCKKSNVVPIVRSISFTADITYYNENYKGECTLDENRSLRLTVLEPESLSGYTVTIRQDGEITAEYLGITFTPSAVNLPFSSVLGGIYGVLSSVSEENAAKKDGDSYTVSGTEGTSEYTLYISPSGLPQSLLIPDERFSVYFYNVALL